MGEVISVKSSVSRKESLQVAVDFMAALRQAIVLRIHDPDLSLDRAAEPAGIGRQSLQRHLHMRGTTFTAEVIAAKKEKATDLPTSTKEPVSKIATAVGFTDSTAFTSNSTVTRLTGPFSWSHFS